MSRIAEFASAIPSFPSVPRFSRVFSTSNVTMPSCASAPMLFSAMVAARIAELTAVAIFSAQPGFAPSHTTPEISATMLLMPYFICTTLPSNR